MRFYLFGVIMVVITTILMGCSGASNPPPRPPVTDLAVGDPNITVSSPRPTPITDNPDLAQAQTAYETHCAHCHGYYLEGQLSSTVENTVEIGLHTVPPHNSEGHTWQHPDQLLIRTIQQGIQNPLNHFPMVGYESVLDEDDILGIIDYMRLYWTDEQIEYQAWLTDEYEARNDG